MLTAKQRKWYLRDALRQTECPSFNMLGAQQKACTDVYLLLELVLMHIHMHSPEVRFYNFVSQYTDINLLFHVQI